MAKTNTSAARRSPIHTAEGARAVRINPEQQLRRLVLSCLLWEDSFYVDGQTIADQIKEAIPLVKAEKVAALAIEARSEQKLRHVPLFIVREMARLKTHKHVVADTLASVIQRADELAEFVAIYFKDGGRQPLTNQVKLGLAAAFTRFDAYQLGKYNRDGEVKLRDVLRLCHAKPKDEAQAALFKQVNTSTLPVPDTWEVALSSGADKKETWIRLLEARNLGAMALLRNLRNMEKVGVPDEVIRQGLLTCNAERVLPFRFITAAKYAPRFEPELEGLMFSCLKEQPKLTGKTALVIDGSGSMFGTKVSEKSELDRFDAAAALAMLIREVCEQVEVIVFSDNPKTVPPRRGFALRDSLYTLAQRSSTNTQDAKATADRMGYDRIIIVTDEQSHQSITKPNGLGYVVNISINRNGIGYGPWTHIDGWSESILKFIQEIEASNAALTSDED